MPQGIICKCCARCIGLHTNNQDYDILQSCDPSSVLTVTHDTTRISRVDFYDENTAKMPINDGSSYLPKYHDDNGGCKSISQSDASYKIDIENKVACDNLSLMLSNDNANDHVNEHNNNSNEEKIMLTAN